MDRTITGITWLALGVGSGAAAALVGGAGTWLIPAGLALVWGVATATAGRELGKGVQGTAGLAAAVWVGWSGGSEPADCALPSDGVTLRGFATESVPRPSGSATFRVLWTVEQEDRSRASTHCGEVEIFGHRGRLIPGEVVEVVGRAQLGWRGRTAVAIDSMRTLGSSESRSISAALARARASLDDRIRRVVGAEQAALGLGLLSGRRRELAGPVRQAFARTGTAHLLAISGFHVGVVAGLLALGLASCGASPTLRSWASCGMVWVYVCMIGSPSSAVRAAGLLTVASAGRWIGRPTQRLSALALVFLVCLLLDPAALSGIGFQLSFAASWGIVRCREWPDRAWRAVESWNPPALTIAAARVGPTVQAWARSAAEWTVRASVVALGATFPTIPLVAWHFGSVSLISIPATLVAMPLAAASIVAVLVAIAADSLSPWLGSGLGRGATEILAALERVVATLANLPFAAVSSGPRFAALATLSALILLMVLGRGGSPRTTAVAAAASWVTAVLLFSGAAVWSGRGTVEVAFLDVGQGDAIAIRSPANRWILVDAGGRSATFGVQTGVGPVGRTSTWDAGARRVNPWLDRRGVDELEVLALTHADADHVGGAAAVLAAKRVRSVVGPARAAGGGPFLEALDAASDRRVPWRRGASGDRWTLDGVTIDVLSPDPTRLTGSANEDSLVLLVRFGAFEALLTGDASTDVERDLLDQLPTELEVLKVGHHGSRTSTADELLARTSPEVAVISAGARNRYGHPAREVVTRILRHGARILRTDRQGTIRITGHLNGQYSVHTSRP